MIADGQIFAVSPDGICAVGADWVESAHDVRALTAAGAPTGPMPASSTGRFRETGGGPRGLAVTASSIYAAQARRLVRWDRARFMDWADRGSSYGGQTLELGGSGTLGGLTVVGSEVYLVDNGTISVYNADLSGELKRSWAVARARHVTADRQGNIWVLQSGPGYLARYSPTGMLLGGFDVSGEPMHLAAHPTADEIYVPDNGPNQNVRRFNYSGAEIGTFGTSYLAAPTPGLLGPMRFCGPRGVGLDSAGNIYVMQKGNPGRGEAGWNDGGQWCIVSKFVNGVQVWRTEGLNLSSVGEASDDGKRFYVGTTGYTRGTDGRFAVSACTIDPFANPTDPRFSSGPLGHGLTTTTHVRDIAGERFLFQHDGGDTMRIYRLTGDIAELHASIQPGIGGIQDWFPTEDGDVFGCSQDGPVVRVPWGQTTATNLGAPPGFVDVRRIEVHGSSVYVSGYGSGEFMAEFDDWRWAGKRLARFDTLPTPWPTPRWSKLVHWGPNPGGAGMDRPASWSADDDLVALGYQDEPVGDNRSYLRIISALDGSEVAEIHWPAEFGECGWFDTFRAVSFRNGEVWCEENHLSKLTMARVT